MKEPTVACVCFISSRSLTSFVVYPLPADPAWRWDMGVRVLPGSSCVSQGVAKQALFCLRRFFSFPRICPEVLFGVGWCVQTHLRHVEIPSVPFATSHRQVAPRILSSFHSALSACACANPRSARMRRHRGRRRKLQMTSTAPGSRF